MSKQILFKLFQKNIFDLAYFKWFMINDLNMDPW